MAEHHVDRVHVMPLRAPIEGALQDCITQHGPITERWVPSAAKRVRGQLTRFLRDREDTVRSLATERTRLRRHIAHLEDALRPFCRPDHVPTVEDVRHACRSLYGAQPWIDGFTPAWARASSASGPVATGPAVATVDDPRNRSTDAQDPRGPSPHRQRR